MNGLRSARRAPALVRPNADLWKVVAPITTLEDTLFAWDPGILGEDAEAFVRAHQMWPARLPRAA